MSVPDRFHISWQNDIASYTIASDVAAETAYPLTNMQNANANEFTVIDMSADSAVVFTGSSATLRTATCFSIHNHTMPSDNTARLELFDGESQTGTTVYDSTTTSIAHTRPWGSIIAGINPLGGYFEATSNMKTHFSLWFESVEYKSFRITISAPTSTDDLLRIDKLWLGFAFCPRYGPEFNHQSTQVEPSEHDRKPGGGMETVEDYSYREMSFEFAGVENSERHVLRSILDEAKKGGDLLITNDPNDVKSQNYEMTSIFRRTTNNSFSAAKFNWNNFGLAVEEN